MRASLWLPAAGGAASQVAGVLSGKDGPGVELLQAHHRYAAVWPSIHPELREMYRWLWPNDTRAEIPDVDELPWMPEKHIKRLEKKNRPSDGNPFDGDVLAWLDQLPPSRGMSFRVGNALRDGLRDLNRYTEVGSRYETMLRVTNRLVHLGAERERGVGTALEKFSEAYLMAVEATWDRDPKGELDRAISGAVRKSGGKKSRRPPHVVR